MLAAIHIAAALAAAAPEEAVRALEAQRDAWNRGDLEASLDAYCPTPEITWVNRRGVSRGFQAFADGMRRDFQDAARMGRYVFEMLDARAAGPDGALITFRWSISRGDERLMGGVSTQLWRPCEGRLRVVFEHAS